MRITIISFLFMISCHIYLANAQENLTDEKCITNNDSDDRYASYSPDGSRILFESNRDGNWNIYLMDATGDNQRQLTGHEAEDRRPYWHPNGKEIIFESNREGKFYLYSLHIGEDTPTELLNQPEGGELMFASYSPDGLLIAASLKESEEKSNIVLLNSNGEIQRWITKTDRRSFFPRWSPDGRELTYFSRKETDNKDDEIYRYSLGDGRETRLTDWPTHNFCPAWSSDGEWIAYVTSMEDIRPEIYVMRKDGTSTQRITWNGDGDTLPAWHPTANKLLITAFRDGDFEICEIELSK